MLRIIFCVSLLLAGYGCAYTGGSTVSSVSANRYVVPAMPGIAPEMNTAGFWISHTERPDAVIMGADEIALFNRSTAEQGSIVILSEYPGEVDGAFIRNAVEAPYRYVSRQELYTPSGFKIKKEEIDSLMEAYFKRAPDNGTIYGVRFGVLIKNTDQRSLPTADIWGKQTDYGRFDRLQITALYAGTPVAVLWSMGDWYFVRSSFSSGWVPAASIAMCGKEQIAEWENPPFPVVVTAYKASLYADESRREFLGWLPLGARLPSAGGEFIVWYPAAAEDGSLTRRMVYLDSREAHTGYVPYTPANMLELAFRMLHAPYGWGGMFGEQDCSGLVRQLYLAVGIEMPRNSGIQGKTGHVLYSTGLDKNIPPRQALVFFGVPGGTVIQFPGHIMLYIGKLDGEPYVLHALWGFADEDGGDSLVRLPARVTVSRLDLAAHTDRGSYIDRAANIQNIAATPKQK